MKMTKITILCTLLIAAYVTWHYEKSSHRDWKKISPFTEVKFEDEKIIAEYDGAFYEVSSIEGISSEGLVKAARNKYGEQWQKRIREDIAEVLSAAGVPNSTHVDLELKEVQTGVVRTVTDAEMTKENRRRIYNRS